MSVGQEVVVSVISTEGATAWMPTAVTTWEGGNVHRFFRPKNWGKMNGNDPIWTKTYGPTGCFLSTGW